MSGIFPASQRTQEQHPDWAEWDRTLISIIVSFKYIKFSVVFLNDQLN